MTKPVPAYFLDGLVDILVFLAASFWFNVWPEDLEDMLAVSKTSSFLPDDTDICQHSDPYKRMLKKLLLKILILVWM